MDKSLAARSTKRSISRGVTIISAPRGDTISRCSLSQYIIMLPKANYENSCMVCRRVLTAFQKAHPHVTAKINYMVQPLTPGICVP